MKKIWVALITAIGTVVAAYIGVAHFSDNKNVKETLSGRVRNTSGSPISGAKVAITEDREVPEIVYSDSDGIFHVEIRPKLHSLRIVVDAFGYQEFVRDENPERIGPLEITLDKTNTPDKVNLPPKSPPQSSVHVEASGPGSTAVSGNGNNLKGGSH